MENLTPKGYELHDTKINFEPKELPLIGNLHGIKDTAEFMVAFFKLIELADKVMEDKKITISDIQYMPAVIKLIPEVLAAIDGIKNIPAEWTDEITDTELAEINQIIDDSGLKVEWKNKVGIAFEIAKKFNELLK